MRALVLTSRENFVWHSMQEIIPFIEKQWRDSSNFGVDAEIIDVDGRPLAEVTAAALRAEVIVLTCFNMKICKLAEFLRFNLKLNINFVIYVHNMATIAFWPFRVFGSANFFKKGDLFVTSCSNDNRAIAACFLSPHIVQLPFCLSQFPLHVLNKPFPRVETLCYIGRISPQKNLHNLFLALSLVRKNKAVDVPKLRLYGKEDHLGSPNMFLQNESYQAQLVKLAETLQISDLIDFCGHRPRDEISEYLQTKSVLCVSTSLHSDENFGMAVLQGLACGNQVLISDWGGHSDFKSYFFERVSLLPVTSGAYGPSLSGKTIAAHLEAALLNRPLRSELKMPVEFSADFQSEKLAKAISSDYSNDDLPWSELADRILQSRRKYESTNATQIFSDFGDPLFNEISGYYIGRTDRRRPDDKLSQNLVPWASLVDGQIKIRDPHKGNFSFQITPDGNYTVLDINGNSAKISEKTYTDLTSSAWLY